MEWLGLSKIAFTHSKSPLRLTRKDGSLTDLVREVKTAMPICWLNPFLFNGHLQTMWTAIKTRGPPIYYRRRIFDADHKPYKGTFAVDFVVEPHEDVEEALPPRTAYFSEEAFSRIGSDDTRPMLFVLHGLSGGSHEIYLRRAIEPLVLNDRRWDVCVVNARGCANSKVTTGVMFNARATWDVRQVIRWARKTYPNRPFFGLGFSLGANILTNYVGEEGPMCPLKAAVSVANPFDLEVSNKALQRSFLGKNIYSRIMAYNLKKLITTHKEKLLAYAKLDWDQIQVVTYLHEFDRAVQTVTWGYPTETAYYRDASSADAVLAIRIPFLALNAADDPIAANEAIPYEEFKQNPHTVLCKTSMGGHLSWFKLGGGQWHSESICNFLRKMASEIDLGSIAAAANDAEVNGGFVTHFNPVRRKLEIVGE